jgi:hypothetical protein
MDELQEWAMQPYRLLMGEAFIYLLALVCVYQVLNWIGILVRRLFNVR